MARLDTVAADGRVVNVAFTDRTDGDFRIEPWDPVGPDGASTARSSDELNERRLRLVDRPWTWLRQVHGARVVTVSAPGDMAGAEADGAVTASSGCPLAVMTADCAPVVLVAERGVAVVHAGWRGLVSGVIDQAASQLRAIGGDPIASMLGPCISPDAYEFGTADLAAAAEALGDDVRARTTWDMPALDVPAAVAVACERAGWPRPELRPACTSDERWYSHRMRADTGRQVTVAWLTDEGGSS